MASRIGRLESSGNGSIFLINNISPTPEATQARTNLNVLGSLGPDADACFPKNTPTDDRVYGGTFAATKLISDLLDADPHDMKLNLPDGLKLNGRSSFYELFYSVIASTPSLPAGGLDEALRSLGPGDFLILMLGGWELVPKNNIGHYSGTGVFAGPTRTQLKFSPRP